MYELLVKIFHFLYIPAALADLVWPVFPFIGVAAVLVIAVIFLVLMERKVLAWLTVRKGPNRVGPYGYFQTIADAIKLLFKEDIIPSQANKYLFTIAPLIVFFPVMVIYGLVPFSEKLIAIDVPTGILLIIAVSSISTLGIILAGWSSNNKYSLLGAMRSAAQAISYEIPLVLAALSVCILAGSMNMQTIVAAQAGGLAKFPLLNWNVFSWNIIPCFIGFIIFFICTLAEINRVPFDLPEAESELVSGYNTEYSGMKFALFFLGEYAAMFIMSVIIACLFLGGYTSPFNDYLTHIVLGNISLLKPVESLFTHIEQVFWLSGKTYTVIFLMIWIRATLPRLRVDKLMSFSWKFLLPIALLNIFIVSVIKYLIG